MISHHILAILLFFSAKCNAFSPNKPFRMPIPMLEMTIDNTKGTVLIIQGQDSISELGYEFSKYLSKRAPEMNIVLLHDNDINAERPTVRCSQFNNV